MEKSGRGARSSVGFLFPAGLLLVGVVSPLSGQVRATMQVSASVVSSGPSAEGLRMAVASLSLPARVRATRLATVSRRGGTGPLRSQTGSPKPTEVVEIHFLRN